MNPSDSMLRFAPKTLGVLCVILGTCLALLPQLGATTFYYTFGKASGGAAMLEVDEVTGEIRKHQPLGTADLDLPKKLAVSEDGQQVVVTSDEGTKAWIYQTGEEPQLLGTVELEGKTEDVVAKAGSAFLVATKGWFYSINLKTAKIERSWNSRDGLTPPGRKGEDILLVPGKDQALVTFQKDSEKGKNLGSRVLLFDLKSFTPLGDLQLPRDHAGLHLGNDLREQGPNPEMMFIAPKTNTLVVSLDLYGALAFTELDSAMRGTWKRLQYMPCALSGGWGTAFPDRGVLFEAAEKEFLLVSNAAANGGMTLVDVGRRKVLQEFACPAGTENSVLLPTAKTAVTVVSGKIKSRGDEAVQSRMEPGKELLVFDLKSLDAYRPITISQIPWEK
ncbi:MAG: hypothetical protein ACAI34_19375, partial [Verrucomicrobium sp.]